LLPGAGERLINSGHLVLFRAAAQIFVAAMGASNFTYAEASWTQALADWIGTHTRAFAALGGVPKRRDTQGPLSRPRIP
jgi:transposase